MLVNRLHNTGCINRTDHSHQDNISKVLKTAFYGFYSSDYYSCYLNYYSDTIQNHQIRITKHRTIFTVKNIDNFYG